jgi:predicted nucleic acid-binding protein
LTAVVYSKEEKGSLDNYSTRMPLFINPVICGEVSIGFQSIEELKEALAGCGLRMLAIPSKEALFLAGKAYLKYRRRKGSNASPLPDFFIGAHAAVENLLLMTRDVQRIKTCRRLWKRLPEDPAV